MPGFLLYSEKYQPVKAREYFRFLFPIFICAIVTVILVMLLREYYRFTSIMVSIAFYSALAMAVYLILLSSFSAMRSEMKDLFLIICGVVRKK
jgi:hypothetical protein